MDCRPGDRRPIGTRPLLALFILDTAGFSFTAAILFRTRAEIHPGTVQTARRELPAPSFAGYFGATAKGNSTAFVLLTALTNLAYQRMHWALSAFLRDVLPVPAQGQGHWLSANAMLVVLMQLRRRRRITPYPPTVMMAVRTALGMIGFAAPVSSPPTRPCSRRC